MLNFIFDVLTVYFKGHCKNKVKNNMRKSCTEDTYYISVTLIKRRENAFCHSSNKFLS